VNFFDGMLGAKRLELLRQLVPNAIIIGMLVNPNTTETEAERSDVQAAAQAIGQQLFMLDVSSERDIETVIDASFARYDDLFAAAGTAHAVFRIPRPLLVELTGGRVAEFTG